MAHFILEYSTNIKPETLDLQQLFSDLHNAALETGLFPLKGIRSRAYPCDHYRVADGKPQNRFVHLNVLVGAGRSLEQREQAARALFAVYKKHFSNAGAQRDMALSFELRELEPVTKYNRNTITVES